MQSLSLGIGRSRSPAWWPGGAFYAADFVQSLFMRDHAHIGREQSFSTSRASGKLCPTRAGSWRAFASDQPGLTDLGLFHEPARMFHPVNAQLSGTQNGVMGSGGSLPSGWSVLVWGGLSVEVKKIGMDGDAPFIRLRLFGASAGSDVQFALNTAEQQAQAGQAWTTGLSLRHVAGATEGLSGRIRVVEEAAGAFLAATNTSLPISPDFIRGHATRVLTSGETSNIRARLQFTVPAGGADIDVTLDISLPVLVEGDAIGSPMLTNGSEPIERAADTTILHLPDGTRTLTLAGSADQTFSFNAVGGDTVLPTELPWPITSAVLI